MRRPIAPASICVLGGVIKRVASFFDTPKRGSEIIALSTGGNMNELGCTIPTGSNPVAPFPSRCLLETSPELARGVDCPQLRTPIILERRREFYKPKFPRS